MSICVICTEDIKHAFACQFCSKSCCVVCAKRHALAQAELIRKPCCLFDDCRREFTDEFVDGAYPAAWHRNELRPMREDACAVRAMAMLPQKQALALEYKRQQDTVAAARADPVVAKALEDPNHNKVIDAKISQLRAEIKRLGELRVLISVAQRQPSALLKLARETHAHSNYVHGRVAWPVVPPAPAPAPAPPAAPTQAPRHAMKCPAKGGCNGFVTTAAEGGDRGICGMCHIKVCKECERPVDGEEHRCMPEDLQSVKAIAQDTKPCPHCAVRIHKLGGCSQMWCTSCRKPFDWNSGSPISAAERIHNPYYFEYMASLQAGGGGIAAGGCGGPFNYVALPRALGRQSDEQRLNAILRLILHYRGSMQPALLRRFNACQQNEEDSAACQFLVKAIDESTFKARCFVRDRRRAFHEEQERILDAACECALDVLRSASTPVTKAEDVDRAFQQLDTLRAQFNDSLRNKLSKRFDRGTLVINEDWSMEQDKSYSSSQRSKRPAAGPAEEVDGEEEEDRIDG
jgi:hypothetical protein